MTTANKFFRGWARLAWRTVLEAGRIDPDELCDLLEGRIDGVDPTRSPEADPLDRDDSTPEPVTPLEALEAAHGIARDFRDAGAGRPWDRCRNYDPEVYGWPRDKSRGQSLGVRDWTKIDTIVLHTAAAKLHPDRFVGVPCHGAIADDGGIVLCHHANAYMAHGHKLNSFSIGIEVSGNRDIEDHQVEPLRALVRYYVDLLREKHFAAGVELPIKISPHRHGHSSRVNDCDRAIWLAAGEWAIRELDCELGDVVGSGRLIDPKWREEAIA